MQASYTPALTVGAPPMAESTGARSGGPMQIQLPRNPQLQLDLGMRIVREAAAAMVRACSSP